MTTSATERALKGMDIPRVTSASQKIFAATQNLPRSEAIAAMDIIAGFYGWRLKQTAKGMRSDQEKAQRFQAALQASVKAEPELWTGVMDGAVNGQVHLSKFTDAQKAAIQRHLRHD